MKKFLAILYLIIDVFLLVLWLLLGLFLSMWIHTDYNLYGITAEHFIYLLFLFLIFIFIICCQIISIVAIIKYINNKVITIVDKFSLISIMSFPIYIYFILR